MVWNIVELRIQNQNKSSWNIWNIMLPDSWKSAFKMASEDSQINIAKKYKKSMNLSGFFFKALTTHPTNFFMPLFNISFS